MAIDTYTHNTVPDPNSPLTVPPPHFSSPLNPAPKDQKQ